MVGLAYQLRMDPWIERGRFDPACLEVSAEPFYKTTWHRLHWLAAKRPLIVNCSSLSLGGPDAIDERELALCNAIVQAAKARWLSHPLGFSRAGEIDLGLTVPMALTASTLRVVCDRARRVMDRCGCVLSIANTASPLRILGTIAETDFLNELTARTGCTLLVDLSALDSDRARHGLDVTAWLDAIDPRAVAQVRVTIGPWNRDAEAWPSFARQVAHAARLRTLAPAAPVVLSAAQGCSVECLDRAWSELRTFTSGNGVASAAAPS